MYKLPDHVVAAGNDIASELMAASVAKCMNGLGGSATWEEYVLKDIKNSDLVLAYLQEEIDSVTAIYLAMDRAMNAYNVLTVSGRGWWRMPAQAGKEDEMSKLTERLRQDVIAPWVIPEVHKLEEEIERLREIERLYNEALVKIADWNGAWGPFPERNEAWRAMAIVTAREAVPLTENFIGNPCTAPVPQASKGET